MMTSVRRFLTVRSARQSSSPVTRWHSTSHERRRVFVDNDDHDGDDDDDNDGDESGDDDSDDESYDDNDDYFVYTKHCPIAASHLPDNGEEFLTNSKRNYRLRGAYLQQKNIKKTLKNLTNS